MTAPGSPEAPREKTESPAVGKADQSLGQRPTPRPGPELRGGISLAAYGAEAQLSEAEIWRRLRRGELAGRKVEGQLMIYAGSLPQPTLSAAERPSGAVAASIPVEAASLAAFNPPPDRLSTEEVVELADLPPLPTAATGRVADDINSGNGVARAGASQEGGSFLSLSGERSSSPEMALLLDHLSLAKEENREILKMTQESLRKVSSMSDSIVRMKDALLAAKDYEITTLKAQLAQRDLEIRTLRQHGEDLEMLARTMTATPATPHD